MARISSRYNTPVEAALPLITESIRSLFSSSVTAVPFAADTDFPATVSVDRLWSGIHLGWSTADLGFNYIRIVRKVRDYAYNVNDGLVVYEGDAFVGQFDDTTATGPEVYYYVFWFRNTPSEIWQTRYWTRIWEFALPPNTMPDLLWSLLPSMYRNKEEDRDSSYDMNLHVKWMMAPIFREIEGLTDFFPQLLNVDNTPGPYLRDLEEYVGLIPNLELTYTQQREEIKAAVSSYKSKGLKATLERMSAAISGVDTTVVDYNQQILFRDWEDRTRIDLSNPLEGYYFLQPGDITSKRCVLGEEGYFDFASYGVYLHLAGDRGLEERTVAKLHRTLGDFAPVYSKMYLFAQVEPVSEVYDVTTEITETSWIELDHFGTETLVEDYLLRDTIDSLRDDEDTPRLTDWPIDSGNSSLST